MPFPFPNLIYSGRGYLVFLVLFASLGLVELMVELLYADGSVDQARDWPFALGLMMAAVAIHFMDKKLEKSRGPAEYHIRDIGRPVRVLIVIFFLLMGTMFWFIVVAGLKTGMFASAQMGAWTAGAVVTTVLFGLSIYFAVRKEPEVYDRGLCQDSLFFIPMRYWPLLLPIASAGILKFG